MLSNDAVAVLERLLQATEQGRLAWVKDADGCFVTYFGPANHQIVIRRMYMEAANQIGADPYFVELSMPGWNARFPIVDDSDGWQAIRSILNAAFPEGWGGAAKEALDFLDLHLPSRPPGDD
jgi:hypothetical protein